MADQELIDALLSELAGYSAAGDEENVRGVKLELARHGWKPEAPAKRAEKRPAASPKEEKR